jgi:hypothetical protein
MPVVVVVAETAVPPTLPVVIDCCCVGTVLLPAFRPRRRLGYWSGLVTFGPPFWSARCTGVLLKYASHVGDNSKR